MKSTRYAIPILLASLLAGCVGASAPPGTAASATAQASPLSLIQQYAEAESRGGDAGMASVFTDDAAFVGGGPCTAAAPCLGKAAILQRTQAAVSAHQSNTIVETPSTSGAEVKTRQEVRNDSIKKLGLDRVIVDVTAATRD